MESHQLPLNGPATVEQVAAYYQVSRATVYRLMASGVIPAPKKIGNSIRFDSARIRSSFEKTKY